MSLQAPSARAPISSTHAHPSRPPVVEPENRAEPALSADRGASSYAIDLDPTRSEADLLPRLRAAAATPEGRLRVVAAALAFAGLAALFGSTLANFVFVWSNNENYSHGFLVPFIALYFANEALRRRPEPIRPGGGLLPGVALLAASILGRWLNALIPIGLFGDLSLLVGLAGIVALAGGRDLLRRLAFPLFFLVFMVPLPVALYTMLAGPLQLVVSRISSGLLNIVGIPVLCEGNLMSLPGGIRMFVAEACSGMRQLTGFLALSAGVAYLMPRPWWYRALLVASAVPIAMTANVVRVMLTAVVMYKIDPAYAQGTMHTLEGLLMMGFGLAMLAALVKLLGAVFDFGPSGSASRSDSESERQSRSPVPARAVESPATPPPSRARAPLALAVALPIVGLVGLWSIEVFAAAERPPLNGPLASIPLAFGDWVGRDVPMDPIILRESQNTDYLNRVYQHREHPERRVSLWINYSETGLNLRHSPEICLPSTGWVKDESSTRVVEIRRPDGSPQRISILGYSKNDARQTLGFWYYIFGEGWWEESVRKLPITNRGSHGRNTRGSSLTVEVFCPRDGDPDAVAVEAFAADLLHELEPLLPPDPARYHLP